MNVATDWAVWAASFALSAIFAFAALSKARTMEQSTKAINSLIARPMTEQVAVGATALLIGSEMVASVLVFFPQTRQVGAMCVLALLTLFSALIVSALRNGRTTQCNCFGAKSAKAISADDLLRNAALGALALVSLLG